MYSRDENDASCVIHIHEESPFNEESTAAHPSETASTAASTTASAAASTAASTTASAAASTTASTATSTASSTAFSTASSTEGITFLSPSSSETRWVGLNAVLSIRDRF